MKFIPKKILTILCIFSLIYLSLSIAVAILIAVHQSSNIATYPANGTFQLYNPLRRLDAQEIIGKDFPFFHGIGVPLIHYPVFKLLGSGVLAAHFAKTIVSPLLFIASTYILSFAILRKHKLSIISTALATIVCSYYIEIVYPGNSLLSVRTTMPFLVAAAMTLSAGTSIGKLRIKNPLIAALLALSFLLGTEQGIACIGAFILMGLMQLIKNKNKMAFIDNSKIITLTLILIIVLLTIATRGNPFSTLKYALLDIPNYQGWYFGSAPNAFLNINSFNLLLDPHIIKLIPVAILSFLCYYLGLRYISAIKEEKMTAMRTLFLYGIVAFCISITGYFAPFTQLHPLFRVLFIIGAISLVALASRPIKKTMKHHFETTKYIASFFIVAFLCMGTWQLIIQNKNHFKYTATPAVFKHFKSLLQKSDYEALDVQWKTRIDTFQPTLNDKKTIWSTYTSVYDSYNQSLVGSTGGEDYIIHALGQERRTKYADDFITQKPEHVITLRKSFFPYEEWLWSRHWNFYKPLLENYSPTTSNDSHILWTRTSKPDSQSSSKPKVSIDAKKITISNGYVDKNILITIKLKYKTHPTLLSKFDRYILTNINHSDTQLTLSNPVTLPPDEGTWEFPVLLTPDRPETSYTLETYGLINKPEITINGAEAKVVNGAPGAVDALVEK